MIRVRLRDWINKNDVLLASPFISYDCTLKKAYDVGLNNRSYYVDISQDDFEQAAFRGRIEGHMNLSDYRAAIEAEV